MYFYVCCTAIACLRAAAWRRWRETLPRCVSVCLRCLQSSKPIKRRLSIYSICICVAVVRGTLSLWAVAVDQAWGVAVGGWPAAAAGGGLALPPGAHSCVPGVPRGARVVPEK